MVLHANGASEALGEVDADGVLVDREFGGLARVVNTRLDITDEARLAIRLRAETFTEGRQ